MTSQAQMAAEELGVAPRRDRHGHGRHRPLPVGHGDLRLADDAHVRPGAARRRGRGAAGAAAARGGAARRAARPSSSSTNGVVSVAADPSAQGDATASSRRAGRSRGLVGREGRAAAVSGVQGDGTLARSGSTPSTRSPAPRSTPATSGCPGCSTRGSCARRRTARRSRASTRPRPRSCAGVTRRRARTISSPCCTPTPRPPRRRSRAVRPEWKPAPAGADTGGDLRPPRSDGAPEPEVKGARGDVGGGAARPRLVTFERTYHKGYVAHAPIEPHTAAPSSRTAR